MPSLGSGSSRGSTKRTLVSAGLRESLLGTLERVAGDVVADEAAVRERLRHHQHRSPGAATDVGDVVPDSRRSTTPSRAGSTVGSRW